MSSSASENPTPAVPAQPSLPPAPPSVSGHGPQAGPQTYGAPTAGAPPYGAPQYGAPQYAAPQYGAPQYGAPQYGAPHYVKPASGTLSWAMGFLVFVPIPFLGIVAAGIVMAVLSGAASRKNALAAANGRSAANWGLTALLVSTGLLILHFVLLFLLTSGGSSVSGFYPLGIPITLYGVVVLAHIVLTIIGTIRASSGRVMRVPFAIPFFRGE